MASIVEATNLTKCFYKRKGIFDPHPAALKAVDGVSFSVEKGKTFGLVGESGCGKSTIARMVAGILSPDSGTVRIQGDRDIVFQDPYTSLNPRMTVGAIVGESLLIRKVPKVEVRRAVKECLELVRLDANASVMKYPHQFSGGERQRIAIARAVIRHPSLLILDEPVSSLDVSIQAGILNLLKDLQDELGLTYLFISHDLRVVEFMSSEVAVMKDGRFVEVASREEIYASPKEPYTRALLEAIPKIEF